MREKQTEGKEMEKVVRRSSVQYVHFGMPESVGRSLACRVLL